MLMLFYYVSSKRVIRFKEIIKKIIKKIIIKIIHYLR